jgi:antitoxin HigA-1
MTIQHDPPHPGEFINTIYIVPLGISLRKVALEIDVAPSTFSRLIRGEADISPEMALKLSKAFGRSPESWMQMQANYKLWKAKQRVNLDHVKVIYAHALKMAKQLRRK